MPDRAPAGDRRRRGAVAVRPAARDRLWVALMLASLRGARRRASTGSGGLAFTPLVGAGRGGAAADALRLPVPRRARLHRHPATWRSSCGRRRSRPRTPRRGTPVLLLLAAGRPAAPRGVAAGRRSTGCWVALEGDAGASASRYAALAAIGPVVWVGTDCARHRRPAVLAAPTRARSAEELGPPAPLSQLPSAMPEFFANLVKLPVLVAALIGLRRSRVVAGAAADASMPLALLGGRDRHVRADRRRRRCR